MSGKTFLLIVVCAGGLGRAASAQGLLCQATANPPVIRAEGVAERMGDIQLQCSGGPAGARITGNLSVFMNVAITNRLAADGEVDVFLGVDNGSGFQPANTVARLINPSTVSFSGLSFTLSSQGGVTLRLFNLRGAAFQGGVDATRNIQATLAFNAGALISLQTNTFAVGTTQRGLLSSQTSTLICSTLGSPSPNGTSLQSAISSGTAYSTVRVTEGFPSAFAQLSEFSSLNGTNGTRIMVRYTGVPTGARIYVPDAVVGLDGQRPTSAGDYGVPSSGGEYRSGTKTLLLARVIGTDVNGGGGVLAGFQGSGGLIFPDNLTEVQVDANGSAIAVYEVVDADSNTIQSALIPSFLAIPPGFVDRFTEIGQTVSFGPVSTETRASTTAPVPRFQSYATLNDCTRIGDCNAGYFPRLSVSTGGIEVVLAPGQPQENRFFTITNTGSGNFLWRASVTYGSGGSVNWLRLSPTAGVNRETVRMDFLASNLPPGRYTATVNIDAGPQAGRWTILATMQVTQQAVLPPIIRIITHAASETPIPVVAGSLALITGERLMGARTEVTFNGFPGRVTSSSPSRLIVQVPVEVTGLPNTFVIVKVDQVSSVGALVGLVYANPIIFPNAVLNADYTLNTIASPVLTGSVIQVFATGLPAGALYTGRIHDRVITEPVYAGLAPGLVGIHQFNLTVPVDLPTMTTDVYVCGGPNLDEQTCSPSHPVTLKSSLE